MSQIREVVSLLEKDLEISEEHKALFQQYEDLDSLKQKLSKLISYLLNQDFNRLCNAMYRIDVAEEDFKRVLALTDAQAISQELAQLVIQRELKKVEMRKKYSSI